MKGFITLHVLCYTEESSQLESLGIESESLHEFREELIQISAISSIAKDQTDEEATIISLHGTQVIVKENYEEICRKIRDDNKTN
jgi:hypothetical protein